MSAAPLIAGIELGGTKCVCILARGPHAVEDRVQLPTRAPHETLAAIEQVLTGWNGFSALGIASFGPVSISPFDPDFGHITSTPKPGWQNVDVGQRLRSFAQVPTAFHTDVVAAGLAEARWGAANGLGELAYVTVGTGVGVGIIIGGRPLKGLTHPELGHLRAVCLPGDGFEGVCPYHGSCLEGIASGRAIAARAGEPGEALSPDDPTWTYVADALAQLCETLILTGAPRRIVMGGGVMTGAPFLFSKIRASVMRSFAGYVDLPEVRAIESYIVPAGLGCDAGPLGAIALGLDALDY